MQINREYHYVIYREEDVRAISDSEMIQAWTKTYQYDNFQMLKEIRHIKDWPITSRFYVFMSHKYWDYSVAGPHSI